MPAAAPVQPRRARSRRRGAALVLLALAAGCGYRFGVPLGRLAVDGRAVAAPLFENRTAEPGAEALFTAAAREALARAGTLAPRDEGLVLRGAVEDVSTAPLVAAPGRLPNYRLSATLAVALWKDGVQVAAATVTGHEESPPGADALGSETYRGLALRRLAERVAVEALERLEAQVR